MLVPKWPPRWRQKVIEFWLRWNCDICYPSHAKSMFSLSRTPPKMVQNLFKKRLCNQTPTILNFQPQGASGWQHEPKGLPKGVPSGEAGSTKNPKKQFQKGAKVRSRTDSSKRTEFFSKLMPKSSFNWPKSSEKRSRETSWMKQTRGSNKHNWWLGDGAKGQ